jgi:hypothetical protein
MQMLDRKAEELPAVEGRTNRRKLILDQEK